MPPPPQRRGERGGFAEEKREKRLFRRVLCVPSAFFAPLRWRKLRQSATLPLALCLLSFSTFAQQLATGGASSADQRAFRALVVKYYDAYAKKDLDAIIALWGKDAPGIVSRRDMLPRMFAVEDYRFSEPAISRIKIEGGRASARVFVEREAISLRGPSTSIRKSAVRSDLLFIRENGEWKFWNETPAVSGLANALAAAKADAERDALLAGDQELVNRELLMLLNNLSDRAYAQADYSRALSLLMSQRLVADKLGDRNE